MNILYANCLKDLKLKYPYLLEDTPEYASYYKIFYNDDFTYLKINKLWDGDKKGKGYFIGARPKTIKSCLAIGLIKEGSKRILPLSTTYISFLESLDGHQQIIAFPNTRSISSPKTKLLVKNQKIKDIKFPLDIEEILQLNPELIISYASSSPEVSGLLKLERLMKNIVYFPEYLEKHPLGRAEWVKVMGLLIDKQTEANDLFLKIKRKYLAVKKKSSKNKELPFVLLGKRSDSSWIMPKKETYLFTLVKDSGGEIHHFETFEKVLSFKKKIDYWLPHTMWKSKKDIFKEDAKYHFLLDESSISIFNSSKKEKGSDGFDFWETGMSRPDLIIQDLYNIFHINKKNKSYQLRWYEELL